MNFADYLMIASNIISIALVVVILIQGQTSSGLGSAFGGTDIYRTRRGIEKTLYNVTFTLAGLLFVLALVTVSLQK